MQAKDVKAYIKKNDDLLHLCETDRNVADEKIAGNSSLITRTRGHGVALDKAATIIVAPPSHVAVILDTSPVCVRLPL